MRRAHYEPCAGGKAIDRREETFALCPGFLCEIFQPGNDRGRVACMLGTGLAAVTN
jgi:hypothetical protein